MGDGENRSKTKLNVRIANVGTLLKILFVLSVDPLTGTGVHSEVVLNSFVDVTHH